VPSGYPTTATLLAGNADGNTTVSMSYSANGTLHPASPYAVSDVLTLTISGTGSLGTGHDGSTLTTPFVLQMTYGAGVTGQEYIGWWDGTINQWVNAIAGDSNSNLPADYEGGNALQESYATYVQDNPSLTLDQELGVYGFDSTTNTVWAVIDHNSSFVVIPEPGTSGMILRGLAAILSGSIFLRYISGG